VIFFKTIAFILTLLLVLIFLDQIIPKLVETTKIKSQSDRMKYGYITKADICRFDLGEYESWSWRFLQDMGYEVLKIIPGNVFEGHNFICKKTEDKYFVECRKGDSKSQYKTDIDKSDMQRIVGAMMGERIDRGVVITTEGFTKDARDYTNSLPPEFKFSLIDGNELIKKCWDIRDRQINMYVKQKNEIKDT